MRGISEKYTFRQAVEGDAAYELLTWTTYTTVDIISLLDGINGD